MIRVRLCHDHDVCGMIVFHHLLFYREGAFSCDPPGILSTEEIEQIGNALRHLPQINRGQVGRFEWIEERPALVSLGK